MASNKVFDKAHLGGSERSGPRVLYLQAGVGPAWYGTGMIADDVCRALARTGCTITLATVYTSEEDNPERVCPAIDPEDRNYRRVSFRSMIAHGFRFSPGMLKWLIFNLQNYDVVHANSFYNFVVLAGLAGARLWGVPYLVTTHDVLAPVQRLKSRKRKAVMDWLLGRRLLDHASRIIYSTEIEREGAAALEIKVPSQVIQIGFNPGAFAKLPERGRFRSKFLGGFRGPLVLYMGRLTAKKGLDRLIPAFAEIAEVNREVRLVVAGTGDPPSYSSQVEEWIAQSGLQNRVTTTGLLTGDDKLSALADADLFVLPSRSENFGVAVFEAMACGLPVVLSSGVHLSDKIASTGAGIVADEPKELATAMLKILNDAPSRHMMAKRGRSLAQEYSWEKTAAQLSALYAETRERRSCPGAGRLEQA